MATSNAPSTPNRPAGLNRGLLTLFGLLLVLAGAYVLARGLGLLGQDTVGALGLPGQDPNSPLVAQGLTLQPWVPFVVIVVGVLVGLLCLRWLVAQTRRRASSETWLLGADQERGTTRLDTDDVASAFAQEIETYTGVSSASAVITGARSQPELHLTLTLEDQAAVNEVRDRVDTQALPRLCQALELDSLPTEVLIRLGAKPAATHVA